MKRVACLGAAALALCGCVTYKPAPRSAAAIADEYAARMLSSQIALAEMRLLAPQAQWDGQTWDRLSLFAFAMAKNPVIAEARSKATSAARALKASRVPLPATLTLTGEYANDPSTTSHWLYGATLDVPVDVGGARTQRVGAAVYAALAARYDYMDAVWAVRLALRKALAERIVAAREVEITKALTDVRALQGAAAERRAQAGETSLTESARVRADGAADTRRAIDAAARLAAAESALANALGVSPAAIKGVPISWEKFDAPVMASSSVAQKNFALLARSDILRAAAAYDEAEANLRGEVARQFPAVQVGPGYTWERGLVKIPLSLGLVLPPIDLNRAAIKAAEARRAAAGAHLEAVVASALSALETASAEQAAAQAALAKIRDVELPSARRIGDQADRDFKAGEIDRAEWGAAKAGALQAELAALDALRRVHNAVASNEDALRRPLDGPELAIDAANLSRETR